MKVSLEWLQDFTPLEDDIDSICDALTLSGSKVEAYEIQGQEISNVLTGRIEELEKHPDADRLQICQVDVGSKQLQIVTGATNIKRGDMVPVALSGATLAGGLKIKKGKLRGQMSEGMLCSVEELGYTNNEFPEASEDGIFVLAPETELGLDIKQVLGINDTVIEFEITSNRVDCYAIEGLAREAAVTFDLPFAAKKPTVRALGLQASADLAKIEIQAPELCYRYCGRIITDVKIAKSPDWMQRRLRAAGVRSINNFVDITNYVMLELGQPMHAFDLDFLQGQQIIVREAYEQEEMVTLDEVKRKLDPSMLVIADQTKAVALAGVMGAENSQIREETVTVLLESAVFNPSSVRATSKKTGLRTESSTRFEKGLDAGNAKRALDRACELIELFNCGTVCQDTIDLWPVKKEITVIPFQAKQINKLLGTKICVLTMMEMFRALELEVEDIKDPDEDSTIKITIPGFRSDLKVVADLAEEVARLFDYNNIEPTLLSGKAVTLGGRTREQKILEQIKDLMNARGYYEALTYSFESPKQLEKLKLPEHHALRKNIAIQNPLGEDFSVMRTSMVPSMLQLASFNRNRAALDIKLFEIAYTYHTAKDPTAELPDESRHLTALSFNAKKEKEETFFELKGVLENMLIHLGISLERFSVSRSKDELWLHPGQRAQLLIDDDPIGWLGTILPEVAVAFDAPEETVLLDIQLDKLLPKVITERRFTALPKYPAVDRDLALICEADILVDELKRTIRKAAGPLLESVDLFDVYQGLQIEKGKKSIAFNLKFRSAEKTLNESDVKPLIKGILEALEAEGVSLRQ